MMGPTAGNSSRPQPAGGQSRWSKIEGHWVEWLIPLVCCVLLGCQLMLSVRHLSQTFHESTNLYAGYRYWKCRDFSFNPGQPPLPKLIAAAPLLHTNLPFSCGEPTRNETHAALDWLYGSNWQNALWRGRMAISIFSFGLCFLVWLTARRMFGIATASLATVLLVFEPNALGQGALIDADMAVSCALLFAVFMFYQWVKTRSLWYLPLTGIATGLTLTAKRSGILVIPILFGLALLDAFTQSHRPRRKVAARNLLAFLIILLIAGGTIWPIYGARFAARQDGTPLIYGKQFGRTARILSAIGNSRLLPEAYVRGTLEPAIYRPALPMFVLGHLSHQARWYFYPASVLIRSTVAMLGLLLLAGLGLGALRRQYLRELLFLVLPGGAFLLVAVHSGVAGGIHNLLPVLPFALILIAAGCRHGKFGRQVRWASVVLAGALGLHAASSLHAFPHYLSYANELWGGPSAAYHWISTSDQGEAYYQVRDYLRRHPGQPCWIASLYPSDMGAYGIPCQPYREGESEVVPAQFHGTVILSSEFLSGSPRPWLEPITASRVQATLGGSAMLVYQGDFDLRAGTSLSQATLARKDMENGEFEGALRHARKAVDLGPDSLVAHFQYCRALVATGNRDSAMIECDVLRSLMEESPSLFLESPGLQQNKITPQFLAGLAEAMLARKATRAGALPEAVLHAQRAVTLAPDSSTAHFEYCKALSAQVAIRTSAEAECSTAQALQRQVPVPDRGWMEPMFNQLSLVNLFLYAAGADELSPADRPTTQSLSAFRFHDSQATEGK